MVRDTVFQASRRLVILAICGAMLCRGDAIALGVLSFDQLIPSAGGSPGINGFTISNLSGPFALPPDLPVITSLTFNSAVLTQLTPPALTPFRSEI